MIAYFAPTMNLFGKDLSHNAELVEAIQRHVPDAKSENGCLVKGKAFCEPGLTSLRHRLERNGEEVEKRLIISVRDVSKTRMPHDAPLVHQKD